jgi:hypothetical protein
MSQVKQHYDTRVQQQDKQISKKERELTQMEMLEMELIKNLQNTQNIQKGAYSDLEKALMLQTIQEGGPLANIELTNQVKKRKKSKKITINGVNNGGGGGGTIS